MNGQKKDSKISTEQLTQISKQLILWNQHPSGGYTACPLFANYAYSWLRDGSFIANAMDVSGESESAAQFYVWVNQIVLRLESRIELLLEKHERGEYIEQHEFLHTRYQLDGRDDDNAEWGHFQLDGYGTWLWGLVQHYQLVGQTVMPESVLNGVNLVVRYICAFWKQPNFDCWEERGDQLHPSTLACIYGGLQAVGVFNDRSDLLDICSQIKQFIVDHMIHPEDGYVVKSLRPAPSGNHYEIGYAGLDASTLWLCEPFHVFTADHPVMAATINKIEADLKTEDGGIRRYTEDEYYGGGSWILLTAWYGWVSAASGKRFEAEQSLQWIANQADVLGRLPEQAPHNKTNSEVYHSWLSRWGTPATPLLWSHAMFLVLNYQLAK
ncbi:Glycosyl hydrolases family 15 [Paenibacillus sp. 1_12]|uniref:glycoside hydrolase family 15 protein n=1 Tax=Paenibacillus sp. 1_12 TaxID=1566278 RepID=UPI0008F14F12|nr:glycoside hydrolase family 15 protein [Paenibacillus sp. 1_12]SFL32512.1 Glycosyl hydrolases family 15 [Paenibacillus sp. 1_12]